MTIAELLNGSKTYIVGIAMIIVGTYQGNAELILEGFGLITLRMGIAKIGK